MRLHLAYFNFSICGQTDKNTMDFHFLHFFIRTLMKFIGYVGFVSLGTSENQNTEF
jgi:hypothetical protein